jgi:hypothetical protein
MRSLLVLVVVSMFTLFLGGLVITACSSIFVSSLNPVMSQAQLAEAIAVDPIMGNVAYFLFGRGLTACVVFGVFVTLVLVARVYVVCGGKR